MLFILGALWGGSFLFVRTAAPALGPFITIELRVLLAGLALLAYARLAGRPTRIMQRWKDYLVIGTINAAVPFLLIAIASLTLTASMASILNATTPLFGTLVAWISLREHITPRKIVGISLGFLGVIILVGWSPMPAEPIMILSAGLSILASLFYGIGSVYIKKHFQGTDVLSMAIGQQFAAALVILPTVLIPFKRTALTWQVGASVLGLSLLCTAVAYLFYFYLIENAGPTKTVSVTFLIPFFGVLWGMVFLGESFSWGMGAGLFGILAGVLVLSDRKFPSA